jgi:tetratricopeptide (TPR) repeat protein
VDVLLRWAIPESIAAEEKTLELDPSWWFAPVVLGWNYSALGRHEAAIAAIGRALKANPGDQISLGSAAMINARAGRAAEARGLLDSLRVLGRKGWVDPYLFGWGYAWLGETDRALASFHRAIDEHSGSVDGLKVEFLPKGFKTDPRFHALVRRIGLE